MKHLLTAVLLIFSTNGLFGQTIRDTLDYFTRNVLFDTDKHSIRPDQKEVLSNLIAGLDSIHVIRIELYGHTDSRASDAYNQVLSENRAKRVDKYLSGHGLKRIPIIYTGYGEHDPVETNESEWGMQSNRRTEIKIVHVNLNYKPLLNLPKFKVMTKPKIVERSYFSKSTMHSNILPKKFYPKDSVRMYEEMGTLMDRYMPAKPSKTLVVMDWTRSMYPYGLFLYEWHVNNLERTRAC